jgi:ribosomal protein S24E
MQATIIEEKVNPFFKRKELTVLLKHEAFATPSKAELVKELVGTQDVQESQVVIEYISTKKGICESIAKVMILNEAPAQPVEASKEAVASEA